MCRAVEPGSLWVETREPVRLGPRVRIMEERGVEVLEARDVGGALEAAFVDVTCFEGTAVKREKEQGHSLERPLLAPLALPMLARTTGAILFCARLSAASLRNVRRRWIT